MADLIDRQAALRAVSWDTEAYTAINNLPSAQPEHEIVMCKDCAKRSFTKCPMALSRQSDFDFCSRAERKEAREWDA